MDSDNAKRLTELPDPSETLIIPEGGYKSSSLLAPHSNNAVTNITAHKLQPKLHRRQNDPSLRNLDDKIYKVTYGIRTSSSAQYIAVIYSIPITKDLYDLRTVTRNNAHKLRTQLKQIHHPNFIQIRQVFESESKMYLVCEHAECTLKEVVFSPIFPTEIQLALIISQVSYLNYYNTILIFYIGAC